jgi:hypothetical protein
LHLGDDGKWKAFPLAKYSALTARTAPKTGVVELFAQSMQVCFHDSVTDTEHSHEVLVPPRMVQNTKASTVLHAVDSGVPEFSLSNIIKLCAALRFMLLSEFPDNASSNKRKLFACAMRLPLNCFFVPGGALCTTVTE